MAETMKPISQRKKRLKGNDSPRTCTCSGIHCPAVDEKPCAFIPGTEARADVTFAVGATEVDPTTTLPQGDDHEEAASTGESPDDTSCKRFATANCTVVGKFDGCPLQLAEAEGTANVLANGNSRIRNCVKLVARF